MINCSFYFDISKNFKKFVIQGHAQNETNKNKVNTLCTGVSILSQSIILGFIHLLKVDVLINRKSGLLKCKIEKQVLKSEIIDKINLFISLFLESLQDLKKQYPSDLSIYTIYAE